MPPSTHIRKVKQHKGLRELSRAASAHFRKSGRTLPWRGGIQDPYRIFVSELMLQQTQVERVVPKFEQFIRAFPSWESLARASLIDVLTLWTGLGYNRRAKHLHESARMVVSRFGGSLPDDPDRIAELPGVGPYTARAVAVFAFGRREAFVETNIRTVFIHHCFKGRKKVSDEEILPLVALSARGRDPRKWYAALMDYGSHLKRAGLRLNGRSAHYVRQEKFEGSSRQLRGSLLRLVLEHGNMPLKRAARLAKRTLSEVRREARRLEKEGLVRLEKDSISGSL